MEKERFNQEKMKMIKSEQEILRKTRSLNFIFKYLKHYLNYYYY